jgi:predicted Holliday junction resolvase-like endonuclease
MHECIHAPTGDIMTYYVIAAIVLLVILHIIGEHEVKELHEAIIRSQKEHRATLARREFENRLCEFENRLLQEELESNRVG